MGDAICNNKFIENKNAERHARSGSLGTYCYLFRMFAALLMATRGAINHPNVESYSIDHLRDRARETRIAM